MNYRMYMKNKTKLITIIILLFIIFFIIFCFLFVNNKENNKKSFKKDGVVYALSLNGKSISSFPSKGMYKVSVACENADGIWLYDKWKLAIDNIKGNVICDINFQSTTKTFFNDYITGLQGTEQGAGQIVNETSKIPDWDNASAIAKSYYTNQSSFSSTSYKNTSGTDVTGIFSFSNNMWSTKASAMSSGTYYNFMFNPKEDGYYKFCYVFSGGTYDDQIRAFLDTNSIEFGSSSYISGSSLENSDCIDLGYITSSQYLRIVQKAAHTSTVFSFNLKKVSNVESATSVRYEGKNPNNYVWFNNEYWRIIGVFNSETHGQSDKKLVKLIRSEVLDALCWDIYKKNDWNTASLKSLLNEIYYNAKDGTDSGNCVVNGTTVNCNYVKRGIQPEYRNMIANVTWYLGKISKEASSSEEYFGFERKKTSWDGYIGLMYPSDYGYSVLSSECDRSVFLNQYSSKKCSTLSWLYGKGDEWTLSGKAFDNSSSYGALESLYLASGGFMMSGTTHSYILFRPTLYLDSSVFVYDGDGSLDNPYIIGM